MRVTSCRGAIWNVQCRGTLACLLRGPTPAEPPPYIIAAPQLQLPDTGTADAASLLPLTVVVDTAIPAEKRTITLFTTARAFAASNNQSTTLTPDAAGAARSLLRAPTDSTAAFIPLIGWLVVMVLSVGLSLLSFVLWLYLTWQAYQGKEWEAPFAGPFARKML
jgi:uncharacterized membrane protein